MRRTRNCLLSRRHPRLEFLEEEGERWGSPLAIVRRPQRGAAKPRQVLVDEGFAFGSPTQGSPLAPLGGHDFGYFCRRWQALRYMRVSPAQASPLAVARGPRSV